MRAPVCSAASDTRAAPRRAARRKADLRERCARATAGRNRKRKVVRGRCRFRAWTLPARERAARAGADCVPQVLRSKRAPPGGVRIGPWYQIETLLGRVARMSESIDFHRWIGSDLELRIRAQPGARQTEVSGMHAGCLEIRVRARATE